MLTNNDGNASVQVTESIRDVDWHSAPAASSFAGLAQVSASPQAYQTTSTSGVSISTFQSNAIAAATASLSLSLKHHNAKLIRIPLVLTSSWKARLETFNFLSFFLKTTSH